MFPVGDFLGIWLADDCQQTTHIPGMLQGMLNRDHITQTRLNSTELTSDAVVTQLTSWAKLGRVMWLL